ncbi:MAG: Trm112 family protein [Candidatus Neomarinimicrobiota bacterium]
MSVSKELIHILRCPETKEVLVEASESLITKINEAIEKKTVYYRNNLPVLVRIDGGLLRSDGKFLYPVREDIPILLVDESIVLDDAYSENTVTK